jgi:hypothetical protein
LNLRVNNSVPVDYVDVPLRWDGPGDLSLDSVTTTGLRTEACPAPQQLHLDPVGKAGYWRLHTVLDHRAMEPDTGAILSAWFTPESDTGYVVNLVRVAPYLSYELDFVTVRGTYRPETSTGAVVVCRPGFNCCEYLPGDAQADSLYTSADIVYLVNFTFKGGPAPVPCEGAGDANCDWTITAADIIYMVNHIFKGGPPPCES